jgi:ABC-type methionine transport system ATPase subunit
MAPKKKATRKKAVKKKKTAKKPSSEKRRLWLMYPPRLITSPIIWEISNKFNLITNIRQAEVRDEIGIICLELEGPRDALKKATAWLERRGVKVEPVEINVIES